MIYKGYIFFSGKGHLNACVWSGITGVWLCGPSFSFVSLASPMSMGLEDQGRIQHLPLARWKAFGRPLYPLFVCLTPEMKIPEATIHGRYGLVQVAWGRWSGGRALSSFRWMESGLRAFILNFFLLFPPMWLASEKDLGCPASGP